MKSIYTTICIYLFVWVVLYETPVFNQTDSLWSVYTTISLAEEGNLNIDEFQSLFPKAFHVNLVEHNQHFYNYYPYGVSLLALPYILPINIWNSFHNKSLIQKYLNSSTVKLEKNISSSLLSISACIFFIISLRMTNSITKSLLVVFIFSFCTVIFSCISRSLWQHSGNIILYSFVLFLLTKKKNSFVLLASIPLYFSYVVRPTSLVPIFFISLVCIYQLRLKSFLFLGIGGSIFFIFYLVNQSLFGTMIHPYYDFGKVGSEITFKEALVGNLISPGRGLFIYSPIFLFSIYGFYLKKKFESLSILDFAILLIILFHWIIVSRNINWWGGHSYGYRLLSDLIPFLTFYLIYFLKYIDFRSEKIKSVFFIIFLLVSFYINLKGAMNMNTYFWNLLPNNIDKFPERNWDWKDPAFTR
ncbi:MAG: hypothetical protein IPL26_28050 [Leptospiraceae bacterium]|nr:hypothetical protein [Leptospiraceae bacterium]